ncbi:predicted protein [Histoplasma capsulatum H143]|uniref:Uncharacterized protein n=1 Tax=Ajellomyces capsulatus (strain H143) TaxID=544712 RepID=C6HPE5_AJECH|nr:predicted protein [Histoplasma capsulatum H143]
MAEQPSTKSTQDGLSTTVAPKRAVHAINRRKPPGFLSETLGRQSLKAPEHPNKSNGSVGTTTTVTTYKRSLSQGMLQYHTGSTPQRSRIRCDRLNDRHCGDFDQGAHSSRHKWVSSGSECPGSNCRNAILDIYPFSRLSSERSIGCRGHGGLERGIPLGFFDNRGLCAQGEPWASPPARFCPVCFLLNGYKHQRMQVSREAVSNEPSSRPLIFQDDTNTPSAFWNEQRQRRTKTGCARVYHYLPRDQIPAVVVLVAQTSYNLQRLYDFRFIVAGGRNRRIDQWS